MNPINKPAAPAVGWQQARVLEMQAEYADAFDTQTGSYDEMCAAYGEERKMWNSGGPEMEETIEYQIPYEGYTVPARVGSAHRRERARLHRQRAIADRLQVRF